jgi:hypothetical protein
MVILFLLGVCVAVALLEALLVTRVSKRVEGRAVPWKTALQWGAVVVLVGGFLSGISRRLPEAAGLLFLVVAWAGLHVGLGGLFMTTEVRGSDGTRLLWRWGAKITAIAGALLTVIVLAVAAVLGVPA